MVVFMDCVLLLKKSKISRYAKIVVETLSPYVLWVKFDANAFGIDFIIGSVYLPGENSK